MMISVILILQILHLLPLLLLLNETQPNMSCYHSYHTNTGRDDYRLGCVLEHDYKLDLNSKLMPVLEVEVLLLKPNQCKI